MFYAPGYWHNISLKLASVLEDIGVNETIILKRRRNGLLYEKLYTITSKLTGQNTEFYQFGSQSEGTTTPGLDSDFDCLISFNNVTVIQNIGEKSPGTINLLMHQDENTAPAYCMLQVGKQLPFTGLRYKYHAKYRDKIIVKHTFTDTFLSFGVIKEGPALTSSKRGFRDEDWVFAVPFKSVPKSVHDWLNQYAMQGRLSPEMIRSIENSKSFVVPVGSKDCEYVDYEWRISTSNVERCLMFHLNTTQVQCYVLMKYMLKTYLNYPYEKALSSFMCKNILLLLVLQTHPAIWCPNNLLTLFTLLMLRLKMCIQTGYCPHLISKQNNLMRKKFSVQAKQWLLERLQRVIDTEGTIFLGVKIDDIGEQLQIKLNTLQCMVSNISTSDDFLQSSSMNLSGEFILKLASDIDTAYACLLNPKALFLPEQTKPQRAFEILTERHTSLAESSQLEPAVINDYVSTLTTIEKHGTCLEQAASWFLKPLLCSTLGLMKASCSINNYNTVSTEALTWLTLGLNSDVASSRLKLASVYYSAGEWNTAFEVLENLEQKMKYALNTVVAVCGCYNMRMKSPTLFDDYSCIRGDEAIKDIIAFCVKYHYNEMHCAPRELQYEMFRSTPKDLKCDDYDSWMNLAVVDSLPYLYFLQYKVYSRLRRNRDRKIAIVKLSLTLLMRRNFGHRETIFNLLGQCLEQENNPTKAFQCYVRSLKVRPSNNVARIHICRLLNSVFMDRRKKENASKRQCLII